MLFLGGKYAEKWVERVQDRLKMENGQINSFQSLLLTNIILEKGTLDK